MTPDQIEGIDGPTDGRDRLLREEVGIPPQGNMRFEFPRGGQAYGIERPADIVPESDQGGLARAIRKQHQRSVQRRSLPRDDAVEPNLEGGSLDRLHGLAGLDHHPGGLVGRRGQAMQAEAKRVNGHLRADKGVRRPDCSAALKDRLADRGRRAVAKEHRVPPTRRAPIRKERKLLHIRNKDRTYGRLVESEMTGGVGRNPGEMYDSVTSAR
jgi:hypothetical protein